MAHLEGITNGTMLIAIGAAGSYVRLGERAQAVLFWAAVAFGLRKWRVCTVRLRIMANGNRSFLERMLQTTKRPEHTLFRRRQRLCWVRF